MYIKKKKIINVFLIILKNTSGVTHVVAAKKYDIEMVSMAMDIEGVFLVNEKWLFDSLSSWEWQNEENYPLEDFDVYKGTRPFIPNKCNLPDDEKIYEGI